MILWGGIEEGTYKIVGGFLGSGLGQYEKEISFEYKARKNVMIWQYISAYKCYYFVNRHWC